MKCNIHHTSFDNYRSRNGIWVIFFKDNESNIINLNLNNMLEELSQIYPNVPILTFNYQEILNKKYLKFMPDSNTVSIYQDGKLLKLLSNPNSDALKEWLLKVRDIRTANINDRNIKYRGRLDYINSLKWLPTKKIYHEKRKMKRMSIKLKKLSNISEKAKDLKSYKSNEICENHLKNINSLSENQTNLILSGSIIHNVGNEIFISSDDDNNLDKKEIFDFKFNDELFTINKNCKNIITHNRDIFQNLQKFKYSLRESDVKISKYSKILSRLVIKNPKNLKQSLINLNVFEKRDDITKYKNLKIKYINRDEKNEHNYCYKTQIRDNKKSSIFLDYNFSKFNSQKTINNEIKYYNTEILFPLKKRLLIKNIYSVKYNKYLLEKI